MKRQIPPTEYKTKSVKKFKNAISENTKLKGKCDNSESSAIVKIQKTKAKKRTQNVFNQQAKKLFEELRRSKCPLEKKISNLNKLKTLLRGKINQIIKTHDMSRIVQWMLKVGTPEDQEFVMNEVYCDISEIVKCKYSNHVIKSALKHCSSSIRRRIIESLSGDTVSLLSSKISAPIVEEIYSKYASSKDKISLRRSVYGNVSGLIDKNLSTTLAQSSDLKQAMLNSTKSNLTKLLQKKWCLKSSIVTYVFHDYITNCTSENKKEIIECCRPYVSDLIVTKEGCYVGLNILWNSTAKEKKVIIKSLQENIFEIAITETGSFFIMSLFDSVDDTVLLNKAIISKLNNKLDELILNKNGRRILIYLFLHRDTSFFSQSEIEKLEEADSSQYLKKCSTLRLQELRDACILNILQNIQDNPGCWLTSGPLGAITRAIFQHENDSRIDLGSKIDAVFTSIALYIVTSKVKEDGTEIHVIEEGCSHIIIKKLLQDDASRHKSNFVTLSECIILQLTEDIVLKWISKNRGCFFLLFMLEASIKPVTSAIKEYFSNIKLTKILKLQKTVGAEFLRQKILSL